MKTSCNTRQTVKPFRSPSIRMLPLFAFLFFWLTTEAIPQNTVTLELKEVKLSQVFEALKNKGDYSFWYREDEINLQKIVSVNAQNEPIEKILTKVLKNQSLTFRIENKHIVIYRSSPKTLSNRPDSNEYMLHGTVTDRKGNPIPGANVILKGTIKGTVTDREGKFNLQINIEKPSQVTLSVSFIGYKTQEIHIRDQTELKITLYENTKNLEEVIVVGYGIQKKADLTSAIVKVKDKELLNIPVASIENALQGKAAGVNVSSLSGRPGAGVQIRIRGIGTVNNNNPLYIVDGVPVTDISYLTANDVESIEILKDASSAAIYGTRAANGVVMVTTKRPDKQQTGMVTLDAFMGVSNPTQKLQPADADEYLYMVEATYGNDSPTYTGVKKEYDKGHNTDWWKAVTRKNALIQNYNLGFLGNTGTLSYFLSGNYQKHEGIDRKSAYERYSVRLNTEYEVKKWLKVGENLSVTKDYSEGDGDSGETGFVSSALRADPLFPVKAPERKDANPYNNYGTSILTNVPNPVATQDRYLSSRHGWKNLKTIGNIFAEIRLWKRLRFKSTFGVELIRGNGNSFSPNYYLEADDKNDQPNAWAQFEKKDTWNWLNTLNYNLTLDHHSLQVVLGYQSEKNSGEYIEGNKFGQPNNDKNFQWLSGGTDGDRISGEGWESSLLSWFGRANYAYGDRYLLSASIRRDGSSNFARGNRWGTFPAISVGWKLNNESFFRKLRAKWIDLLKIRAGWGQLGNQRIPGGAYDTFIGGGNSRIFFFNGSNLVQGYGPTNSGNPKVSWEKTETFNVGADIHLFAGKVTANFDWYIKNTRGMLLQIPLPDMFGAFSPWENIGKVRNRGWELSLNYQNQTNDLHYSISANLAHYKNKVIHMGSARPYVDAAGGSTRIGGYCRTMEGMPIGYFYGYITDGIFQTPGEVKQYVNSKGELFQPNAQMGDFRFVDANKDGILDDKDKTYLGDPHPDLTYGFSLELEYRDIDFQVSFTGTYGNEIFNAFKYYTHQPVGFANIKSGVAYSAWTPGSGIQDQPRITKDDKNNNFRVSDFYVENGSYLRCKNIQLGYNFPIRWLKHIGVNGLRLYISAQNLFTITPYSGLDPEICTGTDRANGVDIGVYPQTRIFQLGINLKL